MKKTILALIALLTFAIVAPAQTKITLQNGNATNQIILNGGTAVPILNRVNSTNTFDSTSSATTNLANYLRGLSVFIPPANVGVGISGAGSSATVTNQVGYYFQRSWDRTNWLDWTNVTVMPNGTSFVYTNFTLNIGDYHYLRLYNVSNSSVTPPSGAWLSNRVELFYK